MAGIKYSIQLRGFKETLRLLEKTENIAAPAWPNAMEQIAQLGADAMSAHAPIRSGLLVARIQHRVQRKPLPRWAVAATKALKRSKAYPSGYPYSRLTAFSPYAQSRYKKGTNPNRGWFDRAIKRVEGGIETILQRAADAIARKWETG